MCIYATILMIALFGTRFELTEDMTGSCGIYARWLDDSTNVTTKELVKTLKYCLQYLKNVGKSGFRLVAFLRLILTCCVIL